MHIITDNIIYSVTLHDQVIPESYGQVEIVVDSLIFLTGCPVDNKVFFFLCCTLMVTYGGKV